MRHIAADSALVSQGNVSMEPLERRHSEWVRGGWGTGELKSFVCLKPLIRISSGKGQTFTVYHHVTLWETTASPHFHLLTDSSRKAPAWCSDWFLDIRSAMEMAKTQRMCCGSIVPSLVLLVYWESFIGSMNKAPSDIEVHSKKYIYIFFRQKVQRSE